MWNRRCQRTHQEGLTIRVHEYGDAYGGIDDTYVLYLITDAACPEADDWTDCSVSLGEGVGLADFLVP